MRAQKKLFLDNFSNEQIEILTYSQSQNLNKRLGYANMERGKLETLAEKLNHKYYDDNRRMRQMIYQELKKAFEVYKKELLA